MKHLEDNHCETFVPFIDKKRGQYAGTASNIYLGELTDQNINNNINACLYTQLLSDWADFSPADTTKYDAAMAYGYALMLYKNAMSRAAHSNTTLRPISDYMPFIPRPAASNR